MKYFFSTTKGYRLQFGILFISIISAAGTGTLFPYAIGKIIDHIFYDQQMNEFLMSFFIYFGIYFLNQCSHGVLNYLWAYLKVNYVVRIRKECFNHLLNLKASIWTGVKNGDVINRLFDDSEGFLDFIHSSIFYAIANLGQLSISIGYLLYTNVFLGLIAVIMTPLMAYSIRYYYDKLLKRHQEIQTEKGLVNAWILEMMYGISQWKLLNAQNKVQTDYSTKTKKVIQQQMDLGYLNLRSGIINETLTFLGQLCIYCIAAYCIVEESMTVGQFVACATYFSTSATYFNAFGKKITSISGDLAKIRRIEEFLSWEEEQDLPLAKETDMKDNCIYFENVSFGYSEKMVVKNISLEIKGGEHIAIVGKSGEGKSTLLQLLCRFYEPQIGKIYIDTLPLAEYTLKSLRSQMAIVWQESGLFNGTLRQNIVLSDDKSQDKRIWEILDGLLLKSLVEELEEGLDTVVGSGGRNFSGGQRQRIVIARCIYRQPKILLLDEATSALDEETEQIVNAFIYDQLPKTTILSVAHRFSTVLLAEKSIVIEQGHISDFAEHDVLVRRNDLYRSLFEEYQRSICKKKQEKRI